jgi:CubicO group peptidase (beta-lactamase class C family)
MEVGHDQSAIGPAMTLDHATRQSANALVQRTAERLIADGREIGVQVAAYLDGALVIDVAAGIADPASGRRVDPDTLFHVFSVTKGVLVAALQLQAERGRLDLDDPVTRHWPDYAANGKEATTIRQVLQHRSGLPQMPPDVTPERMCDWEWMVAALAAMAPLVPPGTRTLYQSMTHGWLIGEIVRRTDPGSRTIGQFVREEIAEPLGITDLWIGLPDAAATRLARLVDARPPSPPSALYARSVPPQVDMVPAVFERPDVRAAEIAGVGGIFNARSSARFWAMLAQGGALDGVRLLSTERVAGFNRPLDGHDDPDIAAFGGQLPSIDGFWLGGPAPAVAAAKHPSAICHPGAGNSMGWADPARRLGAAICHNRMSEPGGEDATLELANAIRAGLGLD